MACPQKENGYTAIAHEIVEKLCSYRISGEENQILWVVFRKTYGFNKKEDHISLSQITEMTGLKKPTAQRAISKLRDKNILVIKKDNQTGNVYQFNKDFDKWAELSKKIMVIKKDNKRESKKITGGASKMRHTKESNQELTKDNTVATSATGQPKKKKKNYDDKTPLSISEFIASMRASPQRQMNLLAEYADEKKPPYSTKGQWYAFIDRNVKTARQLSPYTDDQISQAYGKLRKNLKTEDNPRGYINRWTLETISKYLDEINV